MNKKKITSIVIIVCIIACSVIAIYAKELTAENTNNIYADLSFDEEKIVRRINKDKPLKDKLKAKGHQTDYIETSMDKYVESSVMYDMTDEENQYIMSLFEKGYDFEKLIDIYTFLKNTATEIYATEKIYEIGKNNFDSPSWLENAYDIYVGDGRFKLSVDDVFDYVSKGINAQDIMRCYEMCLSLNRSLREVLDEKVSGKTWDEIFLSDNVQMSSVQVEDTSIDEIAKVVKISKHINKKPEEIIDRSQKNIKIDNDAIKEFRDKNEKVKTAKEKILKKHTKGEKVND